MISSGINLVMTVIGFAVSTMFIVFVCTRLICARIQLNASRRSFHLSSRSDLSILEHGLHGLEPLVVANFPTKKYNDPFFSFSEDTQCSVCLSEYHPEDTLRILPFCGHSFHATCIDIWLQQHSTCPVCRISLRGIPEKRRFMQPMYSSSIRSQYGMMESHMVNSYHCRNHRVSTRAHESQRMNPIQEDEFRLRGDGAVVGENNSVMIDINSITKDMTNKCLESQSNL